MKISSTDGGNKYRISKPSSDSTGDDIIADNVPRKKVIAEIPTIIGVGYQQLAQIFCGEKDSSEGWCDYDAPDEKEEPKPNPDLSTLPNCTKLIGNKLCEINHDLVFKNITKTYHGGQNYIILKSTNGKPICVFESINYAISNAPNANPCPIS